MSSDGAGEGRPSAARNVQFRTLAEANPSAIRLRRLRSHEPRAVHDHPPAIPEQTRDVDDAGGRRRSSSAPQRPSLALVGGAADQTPSTAFGDRLAAARTGPAVIGDIAHGATGLGQPVRPSAAAIQGHDDGSRAAGQLRDRKSFLFPGRYWNRQTQGNVVPTLNDFYDPRIVDMLDVVDPEVSTLSSITNVQNSLFVPSLGSYVNRQPTFTLEPAPPYLGGATVGGSRIDRPPQDATGGEDEGEKARTRGRRGSLLYDVGKRYAVLPNGVTLEGWSQEEVKQLNDYVHHLLHSKRSRFKRRLKGFGKYVRQPLGFLVTLYATLITLFGLAWVLFLIGWIYVGEEKQPYATNVIDNVLVALFAVVGDGLIPFRTIDTYHMIFIAHYHHVTRKLRRKMALPALQNSDDLPVDLLGSERPGRATSDIDLERGAQGSGERSGSIMCPADRECHLGANHEFSVLSPDQQARLVHHQQKFAKSHTFYKPHETETHHAFPHRLFVAIVVLLDLHSCLQVSLGACTWSIDYRVRPMALTATILSCSITVNVMAGILITVGDHRTRKKDVLDRLFRQELTEDALAKIRKKHGKEAERADDASEDVAAGRRAKPKVEDAPGRLSGIEENVADSP